MKRLIHIIGLSACSFFFMPAHGQTPGELYVEIRNLSELKSLPNTIKGLVSNNSDKKNIIAVIKSGDYYLDSWIALNSLHSGDGFEVIIKGETSTIIHGSIPIDNNDWQDSGNGIFYIDLGQSKYWSRIRSNTTFDVQTMWEDGRRAYKARYPNLQITDGYSLALANYFKSANGCCVTSPTNKKYNCVEGSFDVEDSCGFNGNQESG